eukprot:2422262-Prymnesium_polylepis.1
MPNWIDVNWVMPNTPSEISTTRGVKYSRRIRFQQDWIDFALCQCLSTGVALSPCEVTLTHWYAVSIDAVVEKATSPAGERSRKQLMNQVVR